MALAPWWSGFFESLVKSTKRCLKKSLFIYLLFNRFHHDYSAKIRLGENTFEQVIRTRDEGAGQTTERGSKLSVPLKNTQILTM